MTMTNLKKAAQMLKVVARKGSRSHRSVTTWSPLASAFNSKAQRKLNLRLGRQNVGLFGIPQLQDYTGFYLLQENAQNEAYHLVKEATSPDRTRKLVEVFDQLSDSLCRVADMADFVRVAHPDPQFSRAAEEACISISGLVEKLNTNVDIHKSLHSVLQNGDSVPTDEVDQRVAELFMFDFEQSGIHLEEEKRKLFVELNEKILMLGSFFMQGSQRPISVQKDKLPHHLRHCFSIDGDNVTLAGLYSEHDSDLIREAAYKLYLHPDKHQQDILEALFVTRDQLANLVGFPTYGHRALNGTLGQSPENVMDFLETLANKVRPLAEAEIQDISLIKQQQQSPSQEVYPWDPPYYTALARKDRCQINSGELRPYLSLGSCMEGLNHMLSCLFGVQLENDEPEYGEVWSHDVHKLAVKHETEGLLGYIYCDFFERSGKPNQDCHFTIQGGRQTEGGEYQMPKVVLMLNLPSPTHHTPSLLTPGMMENLFHEFGHAMHSMLGRTKYQHVTGTRCPTDFAEVPSVLMEYFATDSRVMSKFARHYKTGEPLPEDTINKLRQAKKMFAASELQLQVFYSVLDQVYHGKHPLGKSSIDILADVQNKYYSIPYEPGTAWHLRFGHFVGYGAKYYSYLMSRAVASRIWHTCFKQDPFSRSMGERYRRELLAHGGGKHPADLVQGILSERPTTEKLVQSLLDDLEDR